MLFSPSKQTDPDDITIDIAKIVSKSVLFFLYLNILFGFLLLLLTGFVLYLWVPIIIGFRLGIK